MLPLTTTGRIGSLPSRQAPSRHAPPPDVLRVPPPPVPLNPPPRVPHSYAPLPGSNA